MDSRDDIKQFKKFCWNKAKELNQDISKTDEYFKFLMSIDDLSEQTAYVWCVNAYFEFLNGGWNKSKCEEQINESVLKLLCKLKGDIRK